MAVTVYWVEYLGSETPGTTQHDSGVKAADVPFAWTLDRSSTLNFGNTATRATYTSSVESAPTGGNSYSLTPGNSPIAAGSNSFAKYFQLQFSGSFTQISNAKIWKSAGDYVGAAGAEYIYFSGSVNNLTPAATVVLASEPASESDGRRGTGKYIPITQPTYNNVVLDAEATETQGGVDSVLPNTIKTVAEVESTPGYYSGSRSNLMVFQLVTTAAAPAGAVNQKTISLTYDRQ